MRRRIVYVSYGALWPKPAKLPASEIIIRRQKGGEASQLFERDLEELTARMILGKLPSLATT